MPLVIRMRPRFVTDSRINRLADAGLRLVKIFAFSPQANTPAEALPERQSAATTRRRYKELSNGLPHRLHVSKTGGTPLLLWGGEGLQGCIPPESVFPGKDGHS